MYIHFSGSWRSGSASASHAEGHRFKSCTAHHLIKSTPIYWGCFFVPWAVSKQTALLAAGFERRSVVFVCAPNYSAVRKAKTASPACRRFALAKRPEGKSCTAHHLIIKNTPIYWGCFFIPWAVSKQTALLAAGFERRSVVFVCALNRSAVCKAKTASPACRRFCVSKTTGRQILYCPPFRTLHLLQGFLLAVSKQTALLAAGFECAKS